MKLKTTLRTVFWVTIALAIGIFLASLAFFSLENFNFRKINQSQNTVLGIESLTGGGEELSGINQSNRPKYFYLNSINTEPKVSAKAYLVGDLNTGEVILSKNQDKKFPIASVSKLMTALVTHLIAPKEDLAVVSKTALSTKGTNGELLLGEKIKTSDLLYPLLLESSNDAAEVLAQNHPAGRAVFVGLMNKKVKDYDSYKLLDEKEELRGVLMGDELSEEISK